MTARVFVSYRRDDSKHAAGRLVERLDERFTLFMDVDRIRPGADFTKVVREAVDQTDVLLAVIGSQWLTLSAANGGRRIDQPDDWVAEEIGTALRRGTPVIPVLLDGAPMPTRGELPQALVDLANRQAMKITHESFAPDCTRLILTIEDIVRELLAANYARGVQQLEAGEWTAAEATFGALLDRQANYHDAERLLALAQLRGRSISKEFEESRISAERDDSPPPSNSSIRLGQIGRVSTPIVRPREHPTRPRAAAIVGRGLAVVLGVALLGIIVLAIARYLSGAPSGGSTPPVTVSQNMDLSAKLPENIKSAGVIKIGVDPNYAPSEFLAADGKSVQGFDVDLFNAVAAKLGVKTEWQPTTFGSIITGVDGKKYDIGISSFTINPERKQQVDMIKYFNAGTQWATQRGNPKSVDPDNACGKNIAVQTGTVQEIDDLAARQKKCGSNKSTF